MHKYTHFPSHQTLYITVFSSADNSIPHLFKNNSILWYIVSNLQWTFRKDWQLVRTIHRTSVSTSQKCKYVDDHFYLFFNNWYYWPCCFHSFGACLILFIDVNVDCLRKVLWTCNNRRNVAYWNSYTGRQVILWFLALM